MALLGTKLHLSAPRRRLVPRPRLTDRLPVEADLLPRMILLSAPAGFGKTTLLSQWLTRWRADQQGGSRHVAWLSLDAEDSDPRRFLANLLGAVQAVAPQVGADATHLLQGGGSAVIPAVLVSLINDLDHRGAPVVLALDDYHVIESPEVHEAVAYLLDHLPAHVSVALTTRADPPLPVTRLRGRGELLELRAADLRFTVPETASFLNDVMGLDLDPRHVDALERRTEGWAAGLQLAALSLRDRGDPGVFVDTFAGSHRFVLDYLVEEVLNGQSPTVRAFLLDTAVLAQLTGPLCDALTGRDDGQSTLEALERDNLFVVALDERREWYRYHHLFADTLQARLASEHPARVHALHRAAARWYAGHDRVEEAIAHARAGQDHEHAADLVERALPEASRQRQDRTIRGWLRGLPDEVVRARPVLEVTTAWCRLGDGDLDGAEEHLRNAEDALEARPPDHHHTAELGQLPMSIAMYRAAIAQARGDTAGTAAQAQRVLDLAGPTDQFARGAGAGFLGLARWADGELGAAIETFTDAVRSLHAAGNLTDELGATVVLAEMWRARGRPAHAGQLHERALGSARQRPQVALPVAADLHVGLAEALRERGDLDGARDHLQAARDLGEIASLPENRHRWEVVMAGVQRASGDLDAAADLLGQAQRLYLPGFFPDVRPISALRARVDVARDRLDLARDWADDRGLTITDDLSYRVECDHLTLARLLIAEGRPDDALALLDRLLAAADAAGREGSVVEVLMLSALAHQAVGRVDAAILPLGRALRTGVPAGYVRLFLDEGRPMELLLQQLEHRQLATDVLPRLRRTRATDVPAPGALTAGLSERELEVMRLLATELTGPEIARHLFVSVNTVRSHTRHIFTKLDVSTRRAAVRRATELGLL